MIMKQLSEIRIKAGIKPNLYYEQLTGLNINKLQPEVDRFVPSLVEQLVIILESPTTDDIKLDDIKNLIQV